MSNITVNNNPIITAYNLIEQVIRENVTDLNNARNSLPTSREKQWIFPAVPEDEANFYPRIAILLNNVNYKNFGAAEFGWYHTDKTSGSVTDVKMNYAIMSVTIGVFTKKRDEFKITLPGETTEKYIKGRLLNTYLMGKVEKALRNNQDTFFQNNVVDFSVNNASTTYNDSGQLFASDIGLTIVIPNTWGKEYTIGELIQVINKNYKVTYDLVYEEEEEEEEEGGEDGEEEGED